MAYYNSQLYYVSGTGRMDISNTYQSSFVCSFYLDISIVSALCVTYLVCVYYVCTKFCLSLILV